MLANLIAKRVPLLTVPAVEMPVGSPTPELKGLLPEGVVVAFEVPGGGLIGGRSATLDGGSERRS